MVDTEEPMVGQEVSMADPLMELGTLVPDLAMNNLFTILCTVTFLISTYFRLS
ncbi:hypothetical protein ACFQZT_01100 [Paenibacillus sp. GCM10027628]|uniref:hypothetical protein n=1 Tax=Paenibacillus sp. GCM10027628 TaxID=3273413 RepID=UPI00362B34E9